MKKSTTLGLVALVLFLGSVLYILDYRQSQSDSGASSSRVFDITTEPVSLIGMVRNDERIEVVRRDGQWFLQQPIRARASGLFLNRLVAEAERLRSVDVVTAEQRAVRNLSLSDYGLDPPASEFFIESGGRREVLRLGGRTPFGEGIYGLQQATGAVIVLPVEVESLFAPSLGDLRDRALFPGSTRRVTRVDLYRREAGFLQLIRREGRWFIQQPLEWAADPAMVQQLLDSLYVLQVQRFVWDAPAPREDADQAPVARSGTEDGLQSPEFRSQVERANLAPDQAWARIMVWLEGNETGEELFLGRGDEQLEGQLYARRAGVASVFTVPAVLGDLASHPVRIYRDRRVFDAATEDVVRLHISYRDERLTLERAPDGRWLLLAPVSSDVRIEVVQQLVRDLRDLRIDSFDAVESAPSGDLLEILIDKRSEAQRQTRLYLEPLSGPDGSVSWIGQIGQGGERMQMSGFAMGQDPRVLLDPARYRRTNVIAVEPRSLQRLTHRSATGDVAVQRRGDEAATGWELLDGGERVLDADALQRLLVVLSRLEAESVVAFDADLTRLASFGLDKPFVSIVLRYADANRLQQSLLLGQGAGAVYAMLQGHGFVYHLRASDADVLRTTLVRVPVQESVPATNAVPQESEIALTPAHETVPENGSIPVLPLQDPYE
jgi:hypothetical protein